MPYKLVRFKTGYKVRNKETKKDYSNKPIPKEKAKAQMRILKSFDKKPQK